MALNYLDSLKEELDGIQETEGVMAAVMEHVHDLHRILETAKKPVREVLSLRHVRLIAHHLEIESQLFIHDQKRPRKLGRH